MPNTNIRNKITDSDQKLQVIINHIRDIITESDLNGNFTYVTPQVYDILGYKSEEVIGLSGYKFIHPEDLSNLVNKLGKLLKNGGPMVAEYRALHKNGHYVHISAKGTIVKENGITKLIAVLRDISIQKETEEKYQFITENINDIISVLDDKFNLLFINETQEKISGFTREEVMGKSPLEFLHPDDIKSASKILRSALKEGEGRGQFRMRSKDNSYEWMDVNGRVTFDSHGNQRILMVSRDITREKEIELKLKESEQKYLLLANHINDIIWTMDLNLKNTYVSPSVEAILGYTVEEDMTRSATEKFTSESFKKISEIIKQHITPKNIKDKNYNPLIRIELDQYHKNGSIIPCEVTVNPMRDKNGVAFGLVGITRNITKRKETEQKLKLSEEKYRTLFEDSPQAVGLINTKGVVVQGNSNIEKIFGYKKEEFIGQSFRKFPLFSKEDNAIVFKSLNKLIKGELPEPQELQLHRKDGSIIWVSMQSSIVKLKNETLFQIITQDISKIKEAEKKLEKQNKELQELSNLKTEFLGRASHELKTPLAAIKGYADLVLKAHKESLNPRVIPMLESIQKGCGRLDNIIHKLIESSKLETSKIELDSTKGDLLSFIKLCVNEVQPLIKMRNLKVNFDVTDLITTKFNKDQIREVISNLLHNAVNYSPPNGFITINYEIKNKTIIISIKDGGIGFTEDEKLRIFQKFEKIKRKNEGFEVISEGSGLGLYISKMIIELHGGEIWVESEGRNKGSTFFFTLPII